MASASETPPNSEELISTFQEVAGITDAEQAKRLLVDFGWDLSVAVENYLAMTSTEEHADSKSTNTETDSTLRRRAVGNPKTPPEEVQAQPAQPNDNNPGWWQWFVGILLTPFRALFRPIFDVLVGFFSSLIPGTLMMDSAKPGKLQESLQEEYGQSPRLFRTSLNEALSHAKKELKFMLIYIHQPDHPDTPRMCRDVIANADFISFINDNVIFWGETAACRQGRQVARSLRASDRPLLALVSLLNGQMRVIFRNLGYIQREELMSKLVIHMEQYQPALIAEQAERTQRAVDQVIREEQDKAFEESLRLDREKMERAQAEKRKAEEEKAAAEEAKRIEENKLEERKSRLVQKRSTLPPEPAKGEGMTRIKVRFPGGMSKDRLFSASDPVQVLFDFVDVQDLVAEDFSLFVGHPKVMVENNSKTFEEAGLCPRALVFVQDNTV
eukprot:m.167883 g.167883  ORF g.167883 m.167883 type:complete len:442 (+) comp15308_c0_seq27:131-1456(+)